MRPSSSTLNAWNRHCAAAAIRQLRGDEVDRRPFGVGVAAHAALEAMANNPKQPIEAARKAMGALLTGERVYKGRQEPPYPPDAVMEGLRVATDWFAEVGRPRGKPEVGVAVDREWKLADYDGEHWYSQLLDLVEIYEDEDDDGELIRVLRIGDWKTAWSTSASELDGAQMRGALLVGSALADVEECGAVEVRLANLRKLRWIPEEPRRFYLRRPDVAFQFGLWRGEFDDILEALVKLPKDPDASASPGIGCVGCPYSHSCGAFQSMAALSGNALDPERWIGIREVVDQAERALRHRCDAEGLISVAGGALGFHREPRAKLTPSALPELAKALGWTPEQEVLAQRFGVTAGNVKKLLVALHKREGADHDALKALEEKVIATEYIAKWGVRRAADVELSAATMKVEPE